MMTPHLGAKTTIKSEIMDELTRHFYDEGFNSNILDKNPYSRVSQVLPFHAWQAGHYDKYGKLAE
jgi:hypothetical protein